MRARTSEWGNKIITRVGQEEGVGKRGGTWAEKDKRQDIRLMLRILYSENCLSVVRCLRSA